jgi:hypothetical protein
MAWLLSKQSDGYIWRDNAGEGLPCLVVRLVWIGTVFLNSLFWTCQSMVTNEAVIAVSWMAAGPLGSFTLKGSCRIFSAGGHEVLKSNQNILCSTMKGKIERRVVALLALRSAVRRFLDRPV